MKAVATNYRSTNRTAMIVTNGVLIITPTLLLNAIVGLGAWLAVKRRQLKKNYPCPKQFAHNRKAAVISQHLTCSHRVQLCQRAQHHAVAVDARVQWWRQVCFVFGIRG